MKISNLKIGFRLGAGFAIITILMMTITGIGVFSLFQSNTSIEAMVNVRYPHTILANTIKADSNAGNNSIRNILIEPGTAQAELVSIEQSKQFVTDDIEKLKNAMVDSAEEKHHLQGVIDTRASYLSAQDRFVNLVKDGNLDQQKMDQARTIYTEMKLYSDAYMGAVDGLIAQQEDLAGKTGKEVTATTSKALMLMLVLASIGCGLGIAIGIIVTRSITKPLNEAVEVAERVAKGDLTVNIQVSSRDETGNLMQALKHMNASLVRIVREVRTGTDAIASASTQIATGTLDLSGRTEQQAGSLEETSSSMMELTATVKLNSGNAAQANQLGISATATAVNGGSVVSQVISTMGKIKDSSKKIVDIIGVIDSIAFQTNILALNAAVEAARAGDQGRGFAVVAAEVRTLAQRSAGAAKEIKSLIRDSVEEIDAGNALVDQAGGTMNEILIAVKRVADIMGEITAASQEQSSGIESVTQVIHHMDEMTQQNAALVEETSAASELLQLQAAHLAHTVSVFKLRDAEMMEEQASETPYDSGFSERGHGLQATSISAPLRLAAAFPNQ